MKGVFEMIGYLPCRDCGAETNVADLVSKLCSECARKRTFHLADLQRKYEKALEDGTTEQAASLADEIRAYQQAEGVRLKDIPGAYRVH